MRARAARACESGCAARPGHRRAPVCEREDQEEAGRAQIQTSCTTAWRAV